MQISFNKESRIAFFLPSLAGGGAERMIVNIAQSLVNQGKKIDIVIANKNGALISEVPLSVSIIDLASAKPWHAIPALVHYLRSEKPDALLSTITNANVAALIAWRISRVSTRLIIREASTLSIELRHSSAFNRVAISLLTRWLYPRASAVVSVSHGAADDLAMTTGVSRNRIRVIYNPVASSKIQKMKQETPEHPWLNDSSTPIVLGIGRLCREKDFSTLIRAFVRVRHYLQIRLVILGEGEERSLLEQLIHKEGMEEYVDLPGFKTNPYAYLSRASLFVLSSRWEGLPGVLVEALACGTPVVSTDCPSGPCEILASGKYGQLVPIGDVEAMAQAILKVFNGQYIQHGPDEHLTLFDEQVNLEAYSRLLCQTSL